MECAFNIGASAFAIGRGIYQLYGQKKLLIPFGKVGVIVGNHVGFIDAGKRLKLSIFQ